MPIFTFLSETFFFEQEETPKTKAAAVRPKITFVNYKVI